MSHAQRPWSQSLSVYVRRALAVAFGAAILALAVVLGVMVAVLALAIGAAALIVFLVFWAVGAMRRRAPRRSDPTVLDARRGPQGWTVDMDSTLGSPRSSS